MAFQTVWQSCTDKQNMWKWLQIANQNRLIIETFYSESLSLLYHTWENLIFLTCSFLSCPILFYFTPLYFNQSINLTLVTDHSADSMTLMCLSIWKSSSYRHSHTYSQLPTVLFIEALLLRIKYYQQSKCHEAKEFMDNSFIFID